MHWNLVYGVPGAWWLESLLLTKTPRPMEFFALGAFAIAFGVACVLSGIVGLVRLRSEPK
jgi:hypothetical protein